MAYARLQGVSLKVPRIALYCIACKARVLAKESAIRRGRGRTCSRACASSLAAINRKDQQGERNPNWKGGITKRQDYRTVKRKRYATRYPEKDAAHRLVTNAIRSGILIQQPCEKCGNKAEAHHDDYLKPLSVRWLCRKHHGEHHGKMHLQFN